MRYTKKVSDLNSSDALIDAGKAKVIAKRLGSLRGTLLHSPIRRYQVAAGRYGLKTRARMKSRS